MYTSLFPQVLGITALLAQYCLAQNYRNDGYRTGGNHKGVYSGYRNGGYDGYGGHRYDGDPGQDALARYIASETPIALQGILNNIGPDGAKVAGAGSGLVIASPSKVAPNCKLSVFPNFLYGASPPF